MEFKSINPYNGEVLASFTEHSQTEYLAAIETARLASQRWRLSSFESRSEILNRAAALLKRDESALAKLISLEMGKPIKEARAEIQKCAWVCRYYAEMAPIFLQPKSIETEATASFVRYEPLGVILGIMPWNFPFWQVFRFAAPTLAAGNTILLKHASNVFTSALAIEKLWLEAGLPEGAFKSLILHHDKMEQVIAHQNVRAISLTGSGKAGSAAAQIAGKYLKKSLLELGGSNAFIVFEDADIDKAVEIGVNARMLNAGQSCIAAKRFILVGKAYQSFLPKFVEAVKNLKSGDPLDEDTQIGTLARADLAENLNKQIRKSEALGAELLLGGYYKDAYHAPSILANVKPGMPAFDEETFGPLAAIIQAKNEEEAIALANQSTFGLGVSLFTRNIEKALELASQFEEGAVFINDLVKSDPRLPFGGVKDSGFGRELGSEGIMEFVNQKTVFVKS
jgi:succinate-semialdehyde dehydrogenase/glutarate-semialdehyde dehydrogenase